MEAKFKALIKEAILEALVEFTNGGVSTLSLGDENPPIQTPQVDDPEGSEPGNNTGGNSGQGGGSADNSGGTPSDDGRPKPDVGVGVWSKR